MIGTHPSVGLVVLFRSARKQKVIDGILRALAEFIPPDGWSRTESGALCGSVLVGGESREAILWSQRLGASVCVFLEFDEDQMVHLSHDQGRSVLQLLDPLMAAAQSCPGAFLVGAGFDLSPPATIEEEALRSAGVARLMIKGELPGTWAAKDLGLFVGHYS